MKQLITAVALAFSLSLPLISAQPVEDISEVSRIASEYNINLSSKAVYTLSCSTAIVTFVDILSSTGTYFMSTTTDTVTGVPSYGRRFSASYSDKYWRGNMNLINNPGDIIIQLRVTQYHKGRLP